MKTIDNRHCMIDIAEHEAKLRQINERFLSGTLSREDVQAGISRLLGEDNLAFRLRERLMQEVNGQLSPKAKQQLSTRQYFMKREELEESVINSGFPYAFFQESATLGEIEQLNLDLIDKKTLMLIIIEALKSYVDNSDESNPKRLALHDLYLKLKKELGSIISFPEGYSFIDYLNARGQRAELEQARATGSVCLKCGSHNIRSKGKEWQCGDCGKRFRKHRA